MRIEEIHVDGFGVLADFDAVGLGDGLTVVAGANEAGKSTLLDFLRGVLFGFPDRRFKLPYRAPLRGGRHGGSLLLIDDDAGRVLVERYVEDKAPRVSALGGPFEGEAALRRVLGGADDALFRNVFAFGLGELSSLESLDREEIRDVVFSAGILGAGRSATNATRLLESQRGALVRPRQGDAAANALRRRLDELDHALRDARGDAASYPSLLADRDRLREELARARREHDTLARRAVELDRLLALWPTLREEQRAREALNELGTAPALHDRVLERAAEVRWLVESRSGHLERGAKQVELLQSLQSARDELEATRAALPGIELAPIPVETRDRIDRLAREVPDALTERRSAEESRRQHAERARLTAEAVRDAGSGGARVVEELQELLQASGRLQGACARVELLTERTEQRRREAALHRAVAERTLRGEHQRTTLAIGALVLLFCAIAIAGFSLPHGLALGALGALGAVGSLAVLGWLRRRADEPVADATEEPELAALRQEVGHLASALGLGTPPTPVEIESVVSQLRDELARRQRLDDLARDADRAAAALEEAVERSEIAAAALGAIDQAAAEESKRLGFASPLSLEGLQRALGALEVATSLVQRIERLERALANLRPGLEEFERTLRGLEDALGLEDDDDLTRRVRRLETLLVEADAARRAREQLEATLSNADRLLRESLGYGASGLAAELRRGDVAAWTAEREALGPSAQLAADAVEHLLGRLRDAERALEALRDSTDVARLELERSSVAAELEAVLEQWLVLGAAKSFLERALARYERERQPRVIAHASELFAEVTDGRYVQLLAHEDEDGKRRGIAALSASGERVEAVDLSRGTAEQLYLCLRLAFAATFAEQAVSLPLVVDDVLVNFDPERARAVARLLGRMSVRHQVLAFTCHPHVVELLQREAGAARVLELATSRRAAQA